MEYRRYGSDVILRIQKGEEILESIRAVCEKEDIRTGSLSGIGAVNELTLGVFNSGRFVYETSDYTGDMEIASCVGNISTMDGKCYLHVHLVAANPTKGVLVGGHLSRGVISLTGEFIIHAIPAQVEREFSPEVGLNLFKFLD